MPSVLQVIQQKMQQFFGSPFHLYGSGYFSLQELVLDLQVQLYLDMFQKIHFLPIYLNTKGIAYFKKKRCARLNIDPKYAQNIIKGL